VYVTPHHQYPTTVTLTPARRLELLRLAAEKGFAILEDDYDHECHYSGRPLMPIASLDTRGLVVNIGTLSKVVAPGLRLGFIAAPTDLIERLVAYRSFTDLQGDPVLECALAELFEDGLIQRHVRKMRRLYRERLAILTSAIRSQLGDFVIFREPSGGTALWVRTRTAQMMMRWAHAARERGVFFDTGTAFTLNHTQTPGARLGFACLSALVIRPGPARPWSGHGSCDRSRALCVDRGPVGHGRDDVPRRWNDASGPRRDSRRMGTAERAPDDRHWRREVDIRARRV
jgi:GntR family transcriptional regulator/MocR family aminotransferase